MSNIRNIKLNNVLKSLQTSVQGVLGKQGALDTSSAGASAFKSASSTKNGCNNSCDSTSSVSNYKRSTAPTALPIMEIIKQCTSLFPLSVKQSFKDFNTRDDLETSQIKLLETLPFFNQYHHNKKGEIIKTQLNDGTIINEFCIKHKDVSVDDKNLNHLIFIHGYGARPRLHD